MKFFKKLFSTKRRKFIVDKKYQFSHAITLLTLQFISALLIAFGVIWFYLFYIDNKIVASHNSGVLFFVVLSLIAIAVITIIWSVRHTHSVAGPVYKAGKILDNISNDEEPENFSSFRKNDNFKYLGNSLKNCCDKINNIKKQKHEAKEKLNILKQSFSEENLDKKDIEDMLDNCIKDLER